MPNNRHIDAFKAFKHTVHYGDHNMFPSSTGLPNKDNKNTIGLPNAYIYFKHNHNHFDLICYFTPYKIQQQ